MVKIHIRLKFPSNYHNTAPLVGAGVLHERICHDFSPSHIYLCHCTTHKSFVRPATRCPQTFFPFCCLSFMLIWANRSMFSIGLFKNMLLNVTTAKKRRKKKKKKKDMFVAWRAELNNVEQGCFF